MDRIRSGSFAVGVLFVAGVLTIQTASAGGGPRDHDGGLFVRLSAGARRATTEIESYGTTSKMDGPAADLNLAIGGVITPNLAIHGTIFGWLINEPDAELGGYESRTLENATLAMTAFGAGATYYVMPINIYVSGSIGAGRLRSKGGGISANTNTGMAADLTVGKEWWVTDQWGLGVAGGVGTHVISDGDDPEDWRGTTFGLRFSATLN